MMSSPSNPLSGANIENHVFATSNTGRFSVGGKLKYVHRFEYFDEVQQKNVVWEAKKDNTLSREQIVRIEQIIIQALKAAFDQEKERKESDQKRRQYQPDFWRSWEKMTISTAVKPEKSEIELQYSKDAESPKQKPKKYHFSYIAPDAATMQINLSARKTIPALSPISSAHADSPHVAESKSDASYSLESSPPTPKAKHKATPKTRRKARRSAKAALPPRTPRGRPIDDRSLNLPVSPANQVNFSPPNESVIPSDQDTPRNVDSTAARKLGSFSAETKGTRSSEASG